MVRPALPQRAGRTLQHPRRHGGPILNLIRDLEQQGDISMTLIPIDSIHVLPAAAR